MKQVAAVIGAGFVGKAHIESLRRLPVRVRGTLVSSGERSDAAAKALGLERAYKNVDEIAADPEVTVVHVCTPNYVHFEQSAKLLRAGKHVLCEKPLAMDSRESATLVALAKETDRVGGVAHVPYRHRARHLRRPIGCGRQDAAVRAARGRGDEALVVRDDRQQRPHASRGRAGPVLRELVARAGDGEIRPSGKVALEPFVQRAADEERARQDQQAEAGENAERDAEGTGHGRSAVAPSSGVRRGPTRTVG